MRKNYKPVHIKLNGHWTNRLKNCAKKLNLTIADMVRRCLNYEMLNPSHIFKVYPSTSKDAPQIIDFDLDFHSRIVEQAEKRGISNQAWARTAVILQLPKIELEAQEGQDGQVSQ